MKVLHVYKTHLPDTMGGVEKLIDQLIISTSPHGVQPQVLTLTKDKNASPVEMHGYLIHKVPQNFEVASCPFSLKAITRFHQLAKTVDIIHYHFPWPFADLMHFTARIKKPTVVTYHSDIVKQRSLLKIYQPLMMAFLKRVNKIVATSPQYINSSEILKQFSDKTAIIPIGLDATTYAASSAEKLNFWKNQFQTPFFLFVGVLRYYKGLQFLIEAAKNIKAPIVIVGSGDAVQAELKNQMHALGVTHVHFLGELADEDKIALLTLCYGFVFPSHLRSEAFGISLLEAAMFGKPLISCEIGTGTTFINIANETGLVVPPADPNALAQAMQFLLEHPDVAAIMGMRAKQRFQEMFTADQMARSYVEIYKDLLSSAVITAKAQ